MWFGMYTCNRHNGMSTTYNIDITFNVYQLFSVKRATYIFSNMKGVSLYTMTQLIAVSPLLTQGVYRGLRIECFLMRYMYFSTYGSSYTNVPKSNKVVLSIGLYET